MSIAPTVDIANRPASDLETNKGRSTWLHWLCLIGVSAMVLTIQLGNTHLWDQDEGYYAAAAAEMYARNDWVTPTFNGALFAHKPPMMFWGMMVGYKLFGVSELGARFVSALFGIGTILLTYELARRLFDKATAFFSALAIGSCIMFTLVARSATADAHLTFFTLLAILLWSKDYLAATGSTRAERLAQLHWGTWASAYAVMGLAVLTKGPIGFLFPAAVIGLFLLTEQNVIAESNKPAMKRFLAYMAAYTPVPFLRTFWAMRPLTLMAMVLLVASPWYALVQWRTDGAFLREFIGVHHLGRFAGAMDNHSGPIYYYVLTCLMGLYPWSAFAIPTMLSWFSQSATPAHTRSVRLVSCWVLVYLVIFSLASTKLPNYVLPAYPALAIMIGRYFALWVNSEKSVSSFWLNAGWLLLAVVGGLIVFGFPAAGLVEFGGATGLDALGMARIDQHRFAWFGIVGVPLLAFGGLGWWLVARGKRPLAAGAFAFAAVSMMLLLCHLVAPELDRYQQLQSTAQSWREQVARPDAEVAVLSCFRPSLVFYFSRVLQFCDSTDEAVAIVRSNSKALLVTTEEQYAQIKHQLPESTQIIERVAQFPSQEGLVVLGDKSLIR